LWAALAVLGRTLPAAEAGATTAAVAAAEVRLPARLARQAHSNRIECIATLADHPDGYCLTSEIR
jgi:hypothetical protein